MFVNGKDNEPHYKSVEMMEEFIYLFQFFEVLCQYEAFELPIVLRDCVCLQVWIYLRRL